MNKTLIDWVRNPDGTQGYTWNPITGCLNHINGMCKGGNFPCYAHRLAHGRLKNVYLANTILPCHYEPNHIAHHLDPFYLRFWPERLQQGQDFLFSSQWRRYTKPAGVFVCDMSDLFGDGVPEDWTEQVLQVIRDASAHSSHRFYLLTKQPQNLAKFSPFPQNCWVGVTATNTNYAVAACYALQDIKAKVKYLSIEPLLAWVLSREGAESPALYQELVDAGINWLIIGAQTKPYKPPKIEWVQEIVEAADKAGIPVFQKDNPKPLLGNNLRQELPIGS
ncbi:hypothetical protein LCGC14_1265380 [marine sediment metagenome]|uniref:Uncharacterized protein n=1 Tax=marine sediment metagenome TaxID=412755 RepID=A0A0F9KZP2_9ZZZZ